jgi:hypothetical protein
MIRRAGRGGARLGLLLHAADDVAGIDRGDVGTGITSRTGAVSFSNVREK